MTSPLPPDRSYAIRCFHCQKDFETQAELDKHFKAIHNYPDQRCPAECEGGCGCQCVGATDHQGEHVFESGGSDFWDSQEDREERSNGG